MLISRHLMTWGVSFLPAKAESLGDTLFLFIPTFNRKSYRREGGGTPQKITEIKPGWTHRNPYFLPDGDHFLFTAREAATSGAFGALYGASLSGEMPREILEHTSNVQYSEGYLLYLHETVLVAQRFDPKSLQFKGDPKPMPKSSTIGIRAISLPLQLRRVRSFTATDPCRRLSPCG